MDFDKEALTLRNNMQHESLPPNWCSDEVALTYAHAIRDYLYQGSAEPIADLWRCVSCGFEDTSCLRDGVNNHWRKGYVEGLRPTSAEAICYSELKRISLPPEQQEELERLREFSDTWNKNVGIADTNAQMYYDQMIVLRAENATVNEHLQEQYKRKDHYKKILRETEAELAALRKQVPEGYVVVPREPTERHLRNATCEMWGNIISEVQINKFRIGYKAMIAAVEGEKS